MFAIKFIQHFSEKNVFVLKKEISNFLGTTNLNNVLRLPLLFSCKELLFWNNLEGNSDSRWWRRQIWKLKQAFLKFVISDPYKHFLENISTFLIVNILFCGLKSFSSFRDGGCKVQIAGCRSLFYHNLNKLKSLHKC